MTATVQPSARQGRPDRPPVPRAKRVLDVVLATIAVVAAAPLLAGIWLAVRLTSRGPVIFRQERLGLGEQPFTLYKFRTIIDGAPDAVHRDYVVRLLTQEVSPSGGDKGLYKLEADPRVTRVGRWLRRTSLDELPQLFNVLRGEMSLVGPRPALAWEAELYEEVHRRRFDVLPGITGLWQVSGRSELSDEERLALDNYYAASRSFWLDLRILVRTVPTVVSRRGAK